MTILGFGDKWLYLQGTFITRPKAGKKSTKGTHTPALDPVAPTNLADATASPAPSGTATPIVTKPTPRSDGAIVHCISISTYVRQRHSFYLFLSPLN